jgi:hypothetical protein
LVSFDNASAAAKRIYTTVLGTLLFSKVHNDLTLLEGLEPTIMEMVGVKKLAA